MAINILWLWLLRKYNLTESCSQDNDYVDERQHIHRLESLFYLWLINSVYAWVDGLIPVLNQAEKEKGCTTSLGPISRRS